MVVNNENKRFGVKKGKLLIFSKLEDHPSMKAKIKLAHKAVIEVSLVISIILIFVPAAAFGYWSTVHRQIASYAIDNSCLSQK